LKIIQEFNDECCSDQQSRSEVMIDLARPTRGRMMKTSPARARGDRVVTLGESLGVFVGDPSSPLRVGSRVQLSIAGAESNVAIGLARLGHDVSYIGRVGDDIMGRAVIECLRGENVDVDHLITDGKAPTAMLVRQHRTSDVVIVNYFRAGAAGSRLTATDIPEALIRSAGYLHVSGITPGLSRSAREAVSRAIAIAHGAGAQVSLDVNYRATVWSVTDAGEVLGAMLDEVDVVFGGEEELCLLVPGSDVDSAITAVLDGHPSTVVCKRGARGATAFGDFGRIDVQAVVVTPADPVGAGDAFVAGFLSAQLDGLGIPEALARAAECGAFAASVRGDWEGLPRRDELGMLARAERVQR
ncbi:MAG: sugar kinase, partial [Cellulomonas sp.]